MKKFLLAICFFPLGFSVLYARPKADDGTIIAEKIWSEEALEIGSKKADDAIRRAAENANNWAILAGTYTDGSPGIITHRADDAARIGIRQGDNNDDAVYNHIPGIKGRWDGVPGDSTFFPDLDHVPRRGIQTKYNIYYIPVTWKEIGEISLIRVQNVTELSYEQRAMLSDNFKKFSSGEIGFTYKKGEIDLTPFSYDTIDVRSFGYDKIPNERYSCDIPLGGQGKSFMDLGDELLAQKWNWSKENVLKYRNDYGLTWHVRLDAHTLDLVPNVIHNLITHRGGHSVVNAVTQ